MPTRQNREELDQAKRLVKEMFSKGKCSREDLDEGLSLERSVLPRKEVD